MSEDIKHSVDTVNLAEILERVLDKGIVIAGDIKIELADVELLTIKVRLMIASVDKAKEMGINWWEEDSYLSTKAKEAETEKKRAELEEKVEQLKAELEDKDQTK